MVLKLKGSDNYRGFNQILEFSWYFHSLPNKNSNLLLTKVFGTNAFKFLSFCNFVKKPAKVNISSGLEQDPATSSGFQFSEFSWCSIVHDIFIAFY